MAKPKRAICKDCRTEGITTKRKAPYKGPRCYSHHKKVMSKRRDYSHSRYILETYNITAEFYWALYRYQGGTCFICERAKGTGRKRLSVDHDHACCNGPTSCGLCVRGLLCKSCNAYVLGHLRDDPTALQRGIDYLRNPPAKYVLRA